MLIRKDNIFCIQNQAGEILVRDKILQQCSWAKRIPFICHAQYY